MTASNRQRSFNASPRERILTCAVDLLALHGFDAMTMRQLGDAAGLDNSSLYRHFKSKSELANAVIDRVSADLLAVVERETEPDTPVTLDRFVDLSAAVGAHLFDEPSAARVMLHWIMSPGNKGTGFALSVPAGDVSRPHGRLMARLDAWLDQGARLGVLRRHASPDAIVLLLSAVIVRPATFGYLLRGIEPKRTRKAARTAWVKELRAFVRGAFAP